MDGAMEQFLQTGDPLMRKCLRGSDGMVAQRDAVLGALDELQIAGDPETERAARRTRRQLASFAPSVTFIGQVKAGKTSLVNSMVGWPGLLPADVNPWTSVVTSLHLRPEPAPAEGAACFTFFDQQDWDRLTLRGGRLGELAGRAGAQDEVEKVRAQIEAMREKSRQRLGRKFELLLGQNHRYGAFDPALVERYVCLGDDDGDGQGRFADITKAAELHLHRPDWPIGLTIRDTPGVNDTFMMREQITIRAIRESRLCVVVLSAHQALSTVDMGLIRLISNVNSREVVLFVNRIDELSDPPRQIEEIRDSITATLREHHGPVDAKILFGSAAWAEAALTRRVAELPTASAEALVTYAETELADSEDHGTAEGTIWHLSGIPSLYSELWERISEGAAREAYQAAARSTLNLVTGIRARQGRALMDVAGRAPHPIDVATLSTALDRLEQAALENFEARFATVADAFDTRLDRSHRSFLDRATDALIKHLEMYGEMSPWTYDPAGLRMLLRSGYQVFCRDAQTACRGAFEEAADALAALYADALGQPIDALRIEAPTVPRMPPPVMLGQTIALDLGGTWWRRWWQRRRGYRAFARDFAGMIQAETDPIVEGLRDAHGSAIREEMVTCLERFFAEQRDILTGLATDAHGRDGSAPAFATDRLDEAVERLTPLAA